MANEKAFVDPNVLHFVTVDDDCEVEFIAVGGGGAGGEDGTPLSESWRRRAEPGKSGKKITGKIKLKKSEFLVCIVGEGGKSPSAGGGGGRSLRGFSGGRGGNSSNSNSGKGGGGGGASVILKGSFDPSPSDNFLGGPLKSGRLVVAGGGGGGAGGSDGNLFFYLFAPNDNPNEDDSPAEFFSGTLVEPVTYKTPDWSEFTNKYAVAPVGKQYAVGTFHCHTMISVPSSGLYQVKHAADDWMHVYVNASYQFSSYSTHSPIWGSSIYKDGANSSIYLNQGLNYLTVVYTNGGTPSSGNPGCFAMTISSGPFSWNTKDNWNSGVNLFPYQFYAGIGGTAQDHIDGENSGGTGGGGGGGFRGGRGGLKRRRDTGTTGSSGTSTAFSFIDSGPVQTDEIIYSDISWDNTSNPGPGGAENAPGGAGLIVLKTNKTLKSYYKKSGKWNNIEEIYYKQNGSWFPVQESYYRFNDQWVRVSGVPDISSTTDPIGTKLSYDQVSDYTTLFQTILEKYPISSALDTGVQRAHGQSMINDGIPSYSLDGPTELNEGVPYTYTLNTTLIPNNTKYYWTLSPNNIGLNPSGGGEITVVNNQGTFSVSSVADLTTEGDKSTDISIRAVSKAGPQVLIKRATLKDTSVAVPAGYQEFLTDGFFTFPNGINEIYASVIGGGGGGSGNPPTVGYINGTRYVNGQGGSGGYIVARIRRSASAPSTLKIVVGRGGQGNLDVNPTDGTYSAIVLNVPLPAPALAIAEGGKSGQFLDGNFYPKRYGDAFIYNRDGFTVNSVVWPSGLFFSDSTKWTLRSAAPAGSSGVESAGGGGGYHGGGAPRVGTRGYTWGSVSLGVHYPIQKREPGGDWGVIGASGAGGGPAGYRGEPGYSGKSVGGGGGAGGVFIAWFGSNGKGPDTPFPVGRIFSQTDRYIPPPEPSV